MKRLWLPLVLFAGCAPMANGGRARLLPVGRSEVTLAPETTLVGTKITPEGVTLPSLQLTLAYHRGITERLELGARLWGFSVERAGLQSWGSALDGKMALSRREDGGRDIALGLSVGYHALRFGGTPEHLAFVSVPLLIGFDVGSRHQLVLGPRIAGLTWWGESQVAQRHFFYGGSIGFAWAIGERWTFLPELILLWSPIEFGGESTDEDHVGASFLSLGLGVKFGW